MSRADPARGKGRLTGAKIPAHLGIIPDGNRRWAAERGESFVNGYRAGFEVAKRLSRFTREIGIHTVTVWAFSTENWRRGPEVVPVLMTLFEEWIEDLMDEAVEEEVRVVHLGRKAGVPDSSKAEAAAAGYPSGLPKTLIRAIEDVEAKTSGFERNVINLAINYGGTDEVSRAVERMIESGAPGPLAIEDFLDTAGQPHPNPDLVWRTSGEFRLSGFLPLQSAYSEIVITPKFFPDLVEEDVIDAVVEYSARARRFGS
jgi:undecaprenyl diphosphate synthase